MNERKIGIVISYLNIFLHSVVGFIYVPILLYYIGKSEYGVYQLIGSFIAYFSIMDFGLTAAVIRFYSRYKALEDKLNMENILAIAMRAYAFITLVMLAFGIVFYFFLPVIFSKSMTNTETSIAKELFLLLLFNIVITVSTMIFRAVINAHEKFLFLKGLESLQLILQPILVVLILQKFPSALAVATVQTILNCILVYFRIRYCFKNLKITIKYHYWDSNIFKEFKKLAFSVFAVTLIDQVFFKTNQVILGVVGGAIPVAVYSVASLIYVSYMLLSTAISGVYLPHITELVAKNVSVSVLTDLFIRIGRLQYFLLALVASGFFIFGKQFISIWAGDSFSEAYTITLLIIIPFTVDLIQNIGLSIMQAQNRYDFRAKVYCVMGIFNLCLAIPLAIKYGGTGCAFATGLSMFLGNGIIMNWYYANVMGLDIIRFWQEIARISIYILPLAIIAYLINNPIDKNIIMILVKIISYTIIYGIIVYNFCLNKDEHIRIRSLINKYWK